MAIEEARSLLIKSQEEIEAGELLLEDVTTLEEKALIAGGHSKGTFQAGFHHLRSYFTCIGHIPISTERIEQNMDYVDSKCSEAVGYGKNALEELDTSYNGLVTFVSAMEEAKEKAGHTNPTSVLNHVIKAIGHYSQMGSVDESFWGRQLNLNFRNGFKHAKELASGFIYAHDSTHESPAIVADFIPRLGQAVSLLEQSRGKSANQVSVILETATNLAQRDDVEIVINAVTELLVGLDMIEDNKEVRRNLKRELVLARANIGHFLKEI